MGGEQGLDLSAISLLEEKPSFFCSTLTPTLTFSCPTRGKSLLAGQAALCYWGN